MTITAPPREISNWCQYLSIDDTSGIVATLRIGTNTGRPTGDENFIAALEPTVPVYIKRNRIGPVGTAQSTPPIPTE